LRQTRQLDFLKDCDINFQYHPTLNNLLALPRDLCNNSKKLEINVVTRETRPILYTIEVQPTIIKEIQVV